MESDNPIMVVDHQLISRKTFFSLARRLAASLPRSYDHVINLCEDRYFFLLAFCGAIFSHKSSILPVNKTPNSIAEVLKEYPKSLIIGDNSDTYGSDHYCDLPALLDSLEHDLYDNQIPAPCSTQPSVIAFTSGSTGKAKANQKFWWQLKASTLQALARFSPWIGNGKAIISTVPAQHMYGLETSVLYPLLGQATLICGDAFFAQDIKEQIKQSPFPVILITTPVHLKNCLHSESNWPALKLIISATATLDKQTARQAEQVFKCPLMEIFGSTETGAIASRRTVEQDAWQLYDGIKMRQLSTGNVEVNGPQHTGWTALSDQIEIIGAGHFKLLGRHTDMIKIAGKRASLADLNIKLNAIDGVVDGILLAPPEDDSGSLRLIAIVVAPNIEPRQIQQSLRKMLDPVFLPRPIIKVQQLPRNPTGKISRQDILNIYHQQVEHARN